MLNNIIANEPEEIREKSFIDEQRIFIPKKKRKKDVSGELTPELVKGEYNDEKFYLLSLDKPATKKRKVSEILLTGGR